jgi:hypothetical protein
MRDVLTLDYDALDKSWAPQGKVGAVLGDVRKLIPGYKQAHDGVRCTAERCTRGKISGMHSRSMPLRCAWHSTAAQSRATHAHLNACCNH